MLRVLFLVSLTFTFAWENFRVRGINGISNTTALSTCFSAGLCTLTAGCCTGHGTCQVDASGTATCVCAQPQECRQGATINSYSGSLCNTYSSQDCCTSGSSDLIFSSNGGCHLVGADATPEKGAKGNLLKRDGAALFSDSNGITDPQLNLTQIDQIIAILNATSRGTNKTQGNMMGLGFLEFALKDIVDFAYNYSNTVTLYGVTYPKVQWQQNTGIKVGNVSIPKQFENTATSVIDVGPLYDYATRIGSTPYLNLTGALAHWQIHHMPFEFITALKFYNAYHYYAARNYEEFFCGQNSNNNPSFAASACLPIRSSFTSDQALMDWFFQQARRSTIRFSQAILEHDVLQLMLIYTGNGYGTKMYGFWDAWFEGWFRRDTTVSMGSGTQPPSSVPTVPMGPSVRLHQEWTGDATRANLTHHLISGLDFLISLRNPSFNYSASSWLNNTHIEGFGGTIPSALAFDVVTLTHTQLQQYGSKVASNYTADLALQLYRVGELGLASYKTHIGCLTNQSSTGVSDLSQDYNVYYGAQIETNRIRQYMNATASIAMASVVPINDVLVVDRVSYWATDNVNNGWQGANYHPDPQFISLPAYDFQNCFNGCNQSAENVSSNAASVVLGYNPIMDMCAVDDCSEVENTPYWRSNGVTFQQPDAGGMQPPASYDFRTGVDYSWRQTSVYRLLPEFLNTLYYKYDGFNTLATHWSGSSVRYLPNQLVDSVPVNMAWSDVNYDGLCYTPSILAPTITRFASDVYDTQVCQWNWPNIME